jgi:hypothetical protein
MLIQESALNNAALALRLKPLRNGVQYTSTPAPRDNLESAIMCKYLDSTIVLFSISKFLTPDMQEKMAN